MLIISFSCWCFKKSPHWHSDAVSFIVQCKDLSMLFDIADPPICYFEVLYGKLLSISLVRLTWRCIIQQIGSQFWISEAPGLKISPLNRISYFYMANVYSGMELCNPKSAILGHILDEWSERGNSGSMVRLHSLAKTFISILNNLTSKDKPIGSKATLAGL